MERLFNFRDVMMQTGVPMSNENNWAVGHLLQQMAAKHGLEPNRILAEKTDPNPSVAAPHVIAHYRMDLWHEACDTVTGWWGDRERQLNLFDAAL